MKPPLAALALALAGCSTSAVELAAPAATTTTQLRLADYPGADRAAGFDDRSADPAWLAGDTVVFALRLRKGDDEHRWLLTLDVALGERLTASIDGIGEHGIELWGTRQWLTTWTRAGEVEPLIVQSKMLPVGVVVADEHGNEQSRSVLKLPAELLGRGLLPAIDHSKARDLGAPTTTVADIRPIVETVIAMSSLLEVVQNDHALADYFWQVVEKPSVWSVITSLGVEASMSMPFEKSVPATRLPPGIPPAERAFVVPMRIDVNGSPALLAEIVALDATRPYSLCGGMIAAVARHPSDPSATFELQLVSARLGEPTTNVKLEAHDSPGDG